MERAQRLAQEKNLTVPQIALAYVLNQPLNLFPLVGAANPDEIEANVEAVGLKLTEDEVAWLDLRQDDR